MRWLSAFATGGLEALPPSWSAGPAPRIPAALASTLIEWVKQGPTSCGLNRANWTYLKKSKGIRVKETAMQTFCHRHHIRP